MNRVLVMLLVALVLFVCGVIVSVRLDSDRVFQTPSCPGACR